MLRQLNPIQPHLVGLLQLHWIPYSFLQSTEADL